MSTRIPLPPFPNGWYVIALSEDIAPGTVHRRRYFGQDLVIYRTESGVASVVDAYCPHLGAHLGYGGAVEGETIVCPFHGWTYGIDGACKSMPYGDRIPPKAVLKTWPMREQDDVILAWYDAAGRAPSWEPPLFDAGAPLTKARARKFKPYTSHPYEVIENSADGPHFRTIHKTQYMRYVALPTVEGPLYRITYRADESGIAEKYRSPEAMKATYDVGCDGPGIAWGLLKPDGSDMRILSRHYVTPIDGELIDDWIISQITKLPDAAMTDQMAETVFTETVKQIEDDIVIWENKRHVPNPPINSEEAPITIIRRWYQQFYEAA